MAIACSLSCWRFLIHCFDCCCAITNLHTLLVRTGHSRQKRTEVRRVPEVHTCFQKRDACGRRHLPCRVALAPTALSVTGKVSQLLNLQTEPCHTTSSVAGPHLHSNLQKRLSPPRLSPSPGCARPRIQFSSRNLSITNDGDTEMPLETKTLSHEILLPFSSAREFARIDQCAASSRAASGL
jgi:hypothetical protein